MIDEKEYVWGHDANGEKLLLYIMMSDWNTGVLLTIREKWKDSLLKKFIIEKSGCPFG